MNAKTTRMMHGSRKVGCALLSAALGTAMLPVSVLQSADVAYGDEPDGFQVVDDAAAPMQEGDSQDRLEDDVAQAGQDGYSEYDYGMSVDVPVISQLPPGYSAFQSARQILSFAASTATDILIDKTTPQSGSQPGGYSPQGTTHQSSSNSSHKSGKSGSAKKYTLSYKNMLNGSSIKKADNNKVGFSGKSSVKLPNPNMSSKLKGKYEFAGWYTHKTKGTRVTGFKVVQSGKYKGKIAFSEFSSKNKLYKKLGNVSVYARWDRIYQVNYVGVDKALAKENPVTSKSYSRTYTQGSAKSFKLKNVPVKDSRSKAGWAFDGWWTGKEGDSKARRIIDVCVAQKGDKKGKLAIKVKSQSGKGEETVYKKLGNLTAYAHWKKTSSVTYKGLIDGTTMKASKISSTKKTDMNQMQPSGLSAQAKNGWAFDGWWTGKEGDPDARRIDSLTVDKSKGRIDIALAAATGEKVQVKHKDGNSLTVYAHWKKTSTLSYKGLSYGGALKNVSLKGKSGLTDNFTDADGLDISKVVPTEPADGKYRFMGWFSKMQDKVGVVDPADEKFRVTAINKGTRDDQTVFAHWEEVPGGSEPAFPNQSADTAPATDRQSTEAPEAEQHPAGPATQTDKQQAETKPAAEQQPAEPATRTNKQPAETKPAAEQQQQVDSVPAAEQRPAGTTDGQQAETNPASEQQPEGTTPETERQPADTAPATEQQQPETKPATEQQADTAKTEPDASGDPQFEDPSLAAVVAVPNVAEHEGAIMSQLSSILDDTPGTPSYMTMLESKADALQMGGASEQAQDDAVEGATISSSGRAAPSNRVAAELSGLSVTVDGQPFDGFSSSINDYPLADAAEHDIRFDNIPAGWTCNVSQGLGTATFSFANGLETTGYAFHWNLPADEPAAIEGQAPQIASFSDDATAPISGMNVFDEGAEAEVVPESAPAIDDAATAEQPAADETEQPSVFDSISIDGAPISPRNGQAVSHGWGQQPDGGEIVPAAYEAQSAGSESEHDITFTGLPEGVVPSVSHEFAIGANGNIAIVYKVKLASAGHIDACEIIQPTDAVYDPASQAEAIAAAQDMTTRLDLALLRQEIKSELMSAGEWVDPQRLS